MVLFWGEGDNGEVGVGKENIEYRTRMSKGNFFAENMSSCRPLLPHSNFILTRVLLSPYQSSISQLPGFFSCQLSYHFLNFRVIQNDK